MSDPYRLQVELEFSPEFLSWVCVVNFDKQLPLCFYTNGWEL